MSYAAASRSYEAAVRRHARAEEKQRKELERLSKMREKLSVLEQARLEVESYENRIALLLSIHKEQGEVWDWAKVAAVLPPTPPVRRQAHEFAAQSALLVPNPPSREQIETLVAASRARDDAAYENDLRSYRSAFEDWQKMNTLSLRVLAGDSGGYLEALRDCSPLIEISELGSSVRFLSHDALLIEAILLLDGTQAIPNEVKSLTATGKVTAKPMARGRFHEIYQDYLCGCVLRLAREVFALLPIDTVLISAKASYSDSATGSEIPEPVLSVALDRSGMNRLDFARLDPSDTIETFPHRCDFRASRKSGAFQPVDPLCASDLPRFSGGADPAVLLNAAQQLRLEIEDLSGELAPALPPERNTDSVTFP
ncbi:MAG: hypothetical protein IPL39_13530 [Opitutaceae bacterium]|nr:hypothetical protein [Opitutaceae bacterium]